jgi:hypothetical protein
MNYLHITIKVLIIICSKNELLSKSAGIYSIGAAIVVLVLGATLRDSVLMPVYLICMMAIACTGQLILDVKRHPNHRFSKF